MPLWRDKPEAWHEILPGVRRRILASEPAATFVLYRIAPGRTFPMHQHPHVQMGVFLEGGGEFAVGPARWTMGPGASYLVPSNAPHELKTDPARESVVLDVFVPERTDFRGEATAPDAE
jgi:quercetin dioxygenase-like cupin family protein